MHHRLFAAIRPPAEVIDTLLDLEGDIAGARWQDESQLHLTLRFFGELDARAADDLDAALGQLRAAPFALTLRGVGHFETRGKAHTLWAGLAPSEPLLAFQRHVEGAARRAGLSPETRKFAPHITLARLNRSSGSALPFLAGNANLTCEPWPVEAFDLMESTLAPEGAMYETVRRYRMAG